MAYVFYSEGSLSAKIYEVASEGGSPRQLMPDIPNWSPDGDKIVFGGGPGDAASLIRVLDPASHQVSTLPRGWSYSPRWSPVGRYIVSDDSPFAAPRRRDSGYLCPSALTARFRGLHS